VRVYSTQVAQDKAPFWTFVNTEMNLRFVCKAGNILPSLVTIRLSRILIHKFKIGKDKEGTMVGLFPV
jgi:hypothetical protein